MSAYRTGSPSRSTISRCNDRGPHDSLCSAQLGHHRRRHVRRRGVAPARADVIGEIGDPLVGELRGEARHRRVFALRRDSAKNDGDYVCRIASEHYPVAGERRKSAWNAPALRLMTPAAMVEIESGDLQALIVRKLARG